MMTLKVMFEYMRLKVRFEYMYTHNTHNDFINPGIQAQTYEALNTTQFQWEIYTRWLKVLGHWAKPFI